MVVAYRRKSKGPFRFVACETCGRFDDPLQLFLTRQFLRCVRRQLAGDLLELGAVG